MPSPWPERRKKLVLDPEKIKLAPSNQSKAKPAIQYYVPSPDGKVVIVGVAPGGSDDDKELHVIKTATGKETGDIILRASLGDLAFPAWLPGNRLFTYNKLAPLLPGAPAGERYDKFRSYFPPLAGHR